MTVHTRWDLISLLTYAARLEHSLLVQYLFAAFSMKQGVDEGLTEEQFVDVTQWERLILRVARQEMEHLGLVCNMLLSIGGAPDFRHAPFPRPDALYPLPFQLTAFSAETVRRFACYERPDSVNPEKVCGKPAPRAHRRGHPEYISVGELYGEILAAFRRLDGRGNLFIGGAEPQVTGEDLGTDFPRPGATGGAYDITLFAVTDLASAERAIELIVEQGEGRGHPSVRRPDDATDEGPFFGHFESFERILKGLREDPTIQAARPVVDNPSLVDAPGCTRVTAPLAREAMRLYDRGYNLMLTMLLRMFAHVDADASDIALLQSAALFPLMTMFIRPMAEELTKMDSGVPGRTAGPSFVVDDCMAFLPHRTPAFTVLGELLEELAVGVRALSKQDGASARIAYIAESMELVHQRFVAGASGVTP